MTSPLRTVTSIDELHIGQSVRTPHGRIDWTVRRIDNGIATIEQFTNGGQYRIKVKSARAIARGELRTYA